MSEFIDLCYICQEAVCFLFSLLLLGDFQEKYFSFRGRNTNQNFCRFFILFYVVYLAYSFYLLLISYSKNTNNPTTSTPISMCPFSFYFCYQWLMLSPYFPIQTSETIWYVKLTTIILTWIEFFALQDPRKTFGLSSLHWPSRFGWGVFTDIAENMQSRAVSLARKYGQKGLCGQA